MVLIDGTTLVDHRVFVLGGDQKVFDGCATLEVSLDAIPTTDLFDTFTKTLCVGNDNMTLTLHSLVGGLGTVVAPIIDLSGRPVKSFLHLVQSPFGVVTFGESFPEVCQVYGSWVGHRTWVGHNLWGTWICKCWCLTLI